MHSVKSVLNPFINIKGCTLKNNMNNIEFKLIFKQSITFTEAFPKSLAQLQLSFTMYTLTVFILIAGLLVDTEPTIGKYVKFVRNLLFAPQDLKYSNSIIFDQNHGKVNQEKYKRAYGNQGQILVEAYGRGLTKKQLQDLGYL